jgi:ABC-type transport system involved in multi-copper enzyme maturation permease subunit
MIQAFKAEIVKLRRPRFAFSVLGLMAALSVLTTVILMMSATDTIKTFSEGRPGSVVLSLQSLAGANGATRGFAFGAGFTGVLMLVTVAVSVASEFSAGTLRNLFLFEPRRARVIGGKLLALATFIAAGFLVAEIAGIATAYLIAGARGISTSAWLSGEGLRSMLATYGSTTIAALGWAAIGAVVAMLLRSVPLALGVALAWTFPFENILFNSWSAAGKWFPGLLLQGIGIGTGGLVSWTRAVLVFGAYALVGGTIAVTSLVRRDVTA